MAKKEIIKITPDGLNLVTILNYSSIAEMNGFYGKEVFFTDGFSGDTQYLFQCLGNLGAYVRDKDLGIDISIIIIGNKIIENTEEVSVEVSEKIRKNSDSVISFNDNLLPYTLNATAILSV